MNRFLIQRSSRRYSQKSLALGLCSSFKKFWILTFIITAILLVSYVIQVNAVAQNEFLGQKYVEEITKIAQENRALEMNYFQVNSLENVEVLVQNLEFEGVGKVNYIESAGGPVVVR